MIICYDDVVIEIKKIEWYPSIVMGEKKDNIYFKLVVGGTERYYRYDALLIDDLNSGLFDNI